MGRSKVPPDSGDKTPLRSVEKPMRVAGRETCGKGCENSPEKDIALRGAMKQRTPDASSMKLGYRPAEAAAALGSRQLLDDAVRGGWIKPVVNRHKLVLFDRADLLRLWARIISGEMPPQRVRH